jgi:hypothetical protein
VVMAGGPGREYRRYRAMIEGLAKDLDTAS